MSSKRKRAGKLYFVVPPNTVLELYQYEWDNETKNWITGHIHEKFGTVCNPSADWIELSQTKSIMSAIIAYKYMGLPLRPSVKGVEGIRLCGGERDPNSCKNEACWCQNNKVYLAPVKVEGSTPTEHRYSFVNCDANGQVAVPKKADSVLQVDSAMKVKHSTIRLSGQTVQRLK